MKAVRLVGRSVWKVQPLNSIAYFHLFHPCFVLTFFLLPSCFLLFCHSTFSCFIISFSFNVSPSLSFSLCCFLPSFHLFHPTPLKRLKFNFLVIVCSLLPLIHLFLFSSSIQIYRKTHSTSSAGTASESTGFYPPKTNIFHHCKWCFSC